MLNSKLSFIFVFLAVFVIFGFGLVKSVKAATTIFYEQFSCYCYFSSCPSGNWQIANWQLGYAEGWNNQASPAKYYSASYYALGQNKKASYNYQAHALFSPTYNYNSSNTYNINLYTGVAYSGGSCKLEIGAATTYSTSPGGTGYSTLVAATTINNYVPNNSPSSYTLKQYSNLTVPTGKKFIVFLVYGCI